MFQLNKDCFLKKKLNKDCSFKTFITYTEKITNTKKINIKLHKKYYLDILELVIYFK